MNVKKRDEHDISLEHVNTFCNLDTKITNRDLKNYMNAKHRYLASKTDNSLEAFEMWRYRKIIKIKWVARVRNTEILCSVKETNIIFNHSK